LKNSDAKLKGLLLDNNASQLPNTTPAIYVTQRRAFCVKITLHEINVLLALVSTTTA
jgi:hypothetical protein